MKMTYFLNCYPTRFLIYNVLMKFQPMILNGFNHFKIIFQIKFVLELTKLKNSAHIYSVYEKKLYPLKFKLLQAIVLN